MSDQSLGLEKLLEQQILGELDEDKQARLDELLSKDPDAREVFEEQRELEDLLENTGRDLERRFEVGRGALLSRIQNEIRSGDDLVTPRRLLRMNSRFILYAIQLVSVLMIALTYVGSMVSVMTLRKREQVRFTENEVRALVTVTKALQKQQERLPEANNAALVEALCQPMQNGGDEPRPYFRFDAERLKEGQFLDLWKRPYVFQVLGDGDFVIYSRGPNGLDEKGRGDDISMSHAPRSS